MFIESIERLHERLREYIEAVYHITDEGILAQRRELLDAPQRRRLMDLLLSRYSREATEEERLHRD